MWTIPDICLALKVHRTWCMYAAVTHLNRYTRLTESGAARMGAESRTDDWCEGQGQGQGRASRALPGRDADGFQVQGGIAPFRVLFLGSVLCLPS